MADELISFPPYQEIGGGNSQSTNVNTPTVIEAEAWKLNDTSTLNKSASVGAVSYPTDLLSEKQKHSIVFEIYSREDTVDAAQNSAGSATRTSTAVYAEGNDNTLQDTVTVGATIAAVWYGGKGITQIISGNNSGGRQILKGALIGGAGYALSNTDYLKVRGLVRLKDMIELHISNPPSVSYGANWDETGFGALLGSGAVGSLSSSIKDFDLDKIMSTLAGGSEVAARGIISAIGQIPRQFGGGDVGGFIDASTGKVANPYKEQLFKSMGFRKFAFQYKFAPRNPTESQQVEKIIHAFRYHMHPEKTTYFLKYPSLFRMKYKYDGEINKHLFQTGDCALTDVKITYGSSDGFNTFKGTQGRPSEINMELAFTELDLLDKSKFSYDQVSY